VLIFVRNCCENSFSLSVNQTILIAVPGKKEKQPISVTHPELAKDADGWDPSSYLAGSNLKRSWKCKLGHIWEAVISNRAGKGYGCPICSGQKILKGFNDLLTLQPIIASEAEGWDPSEISQFSNQKLTWKCERGHIWESTVANRSRRGDGCAVCSSHKTQVGFNDLATTDPDIAIQAFDWDPRTLTRYSNKKVGWICKFGHTWKAPPSSRSSGSGCPTCSGKITLSGFNDLQTLKPEIAKQADGWDPALVAVSSNKVFSWKCNLGHRWRTSVNARGQGKGCAVCANQKVLKGFNDLASTHPELAKEAYGWDPETITAGSSKTSANQWKCGLGHIWKATVALRSAGSGCPVCAGQKAWPGFNDLATTHPEIAKESHLWDPSTLMAGSDRVVDWKCELGHIWKVRVAERKGGSRCPICLGQRVLVGFNDLATTHPEIAKEAHNWNPQTLTAGSGLKRKFKCNFGHIWETAVGHRTGEKATGCPSCSETGFSPSKDGFLYFLVHHDWEMLQIGITNVPDDRLKRHNSLGWELIELRGPMDGYLTQQWETAILRMLKAKGADLSNSKIAGKFDGYSEAWCKSTFEVKSINELMKLTEEFEEG
jgi:hypothetical protein